MAVTGHTTMTEVTRYTAAADQVRLAEAAIAALPVGTDGEQELANRDERFPSGGPKALA
jgi:hypothetical protein